MEQTTKLRRADARRNHDLLLAAAKQVFTEQGPGAPLDDVARAAGVGNATLYRHFPSRQDLIVAVYADEVDDLCARGEQLLGAEPAGDALFGWLATFIEHVAGKRDLALSLPGDRETLFHRWHSAMHETAAALVEQAKQAGDLRADVAEPDLITMANGIALSTSDAQRRARLLVLVRTGVC
jgi:AcrR family transcriptional regulator